MIRDGDRAIDSRLGQLAGEGSIQISGHTKQTAAPPWDQSAVSAKPTYYNQPLLKAPVWKWTVPLYYFVGGAAGASLAMGAAAQLDRSGDLHGLMRRCHSVGVVGIALSGAMLIDDLGRPSRFHHMLRVFRPTSPMNMGVWIISLCAPTAMGAALWANRAGFRGFIGNSSSLVAGLGGVALATYTGVLVANTAVPVWQESRHLLPILFGASAMASAGCILDLTCDDPKARRITYTFGTIGRLAELSASFALERRLERHQPQIAQPFKKGGSAKIWKTAACLTAASLAVSLLPGKSRKKHVTASILGALGSLTLRYAIHRAGVASTGHVAPEGKA